MIAAVALAWWLRPVMMHDREVSTAPWCACWCTAAPGSQRVKVRRGDRAAVAAQLPKPGVIQHDKQDVGGIRPRTGCGHAGLDSLVVRPITPGNAVPGLYSFNAMRPISLAKAPRAQMSSRRHQTPPPPIEHFTPTGVKCQPPGARTCLSACPVGPVLPPRAAGLTGTTATVRSDHRAEPGELHPP